MELRIMMRLSDIIPSHYSAQFQCEALVWIGSKHPELYWDYFLQVRRDHIWA